METDLQNKKLEAVLSAIEIDGISREDTFALLNLALKLKRLQIIIAYKSPTVNNFTIYYDYEISKIDLEDVINRKPRDAEIAGDFPSIPLASLTYETIKNYLEKEEFHQILLRYHIVY
jgi:hypothetical protein